jgi:hypothetical protein
MNAKEAMLLFQKHDDPTRWEYPVGFDYERATQKFREFAAAFDAETGTPHATETGSHIQDASFHSQINLGTGWIRFSNFGDMVSITPDREIDYATVAIIQRLCDEEGYVFIPTEFTESPYTGANPGVTGIRDWWIRYFDWV